MKKFITIFAFVCLISAAVFAQTPVSIDVTSLTMSKPYISSAQFSVTATGLPAPFQSPLLGAASIYYPALEGCRPCFLGESFGIGGNFNHQFRPSGFPENVYVKITLTGNDSVIVLAPTIRLKDNAAVITKLSSVQGKIEIFDGENLIAFDENVDLTGTIKTEFWNYRLISSNGSRRAFDFKNITFTYSQ